MRAFPEVLVEAATSHDMDLLPPMPTPERRRQRLELTRGVSFVLVLVISQVIVVQTLGFTRPSIAGRVCQVVNGVEAGVALVCLGFMIWLDPGTVRRTPATCLPVPPEVKQRLAQQESLSGMVNVRSGGDSYCVRCFVWRRPGRGEAHHCRTCQRCVLEFDHHCGVFGRCIAGSLWGWRGNMPYFKIIIFTGFASYLTTVAAVSIGVDQRIGWYIALGLLGWVALVALLRCSKGACAPRGVVHHHIDRICNRILPICCPSVAFPALIPPVHDFSSADAQSAINAMGEHFQVVHASLPVVHATLPGAQASLPVVPASLPVVPARLVEPSESSPSQDIEMTSASGDIEMATGLWAAAAGSAPSHAPSASAEATTSPADADGNAVSVGGNAMGGHTIGGIAGSSTALLPPSPPP